MKIDSTSYFEGKEGAAGFYGDLRGGYTFVTSRFGIGAILERTLDPIRYFRSTEHTAPRPPAHLSLHSKGFNLQLGHRRTVRIMSFTPC